MPALDDVLDFARLTKLQKLAILLVMLGPESAAHILKALDEHEMEAVASEMTKFTMISQDLQMQVLQEFSDVAVEAGTSIRGGPGYVQAVLEKAVGQIKASEIVGRVSPIRTPVAAMEPIINMEVRQIFNLIKTEQPQTISLVISYLNPEKASEILSLLRNDLREQVVERLATLAPTPIEVVEKVVEVLNHKSGARTARLFNQTGGVKNAAGVLNALDKNLTKTILGTLEERNPELVKAIRQKMFTFEDLSTLDASSLQKVLREVDMRELAISLKGATDKLKGTLLSCISKRAAETVNEEIAFMGAIKQKDIEAGQLKIIEVVRKLEGEGELDLTEVREKQRHEAMV
jgi:flagellar motor switch protein FliG